MPVVRKKSYGKYMVGVYKHSNQTRGKDVRSQNTDHVKINTSTKKIGKYGLRYWKTAGIFPKIQNPNRGGKVYYRWKSVLLQDSMHG